MCLELDAKSSAENKNVLSYGLSLGLFLGMENGIFTGPKSLSHAQIGLLEGFNSNFSDERPVPFHMR